MNAISRTNVPIRGAEEAPFPVDPINQIEVVYGSTEPKMDTNPFPRIPSEQ